MPRDGYAWWYVDALSDCGRHGLTLIAMLGCVFSPWYAAARRRGAGDPLAHPALNLALYGEGGRRWALTERGARDIERSDRRLAMGPSELRWDGTRLVVEINEITRADFDKLLTQIPKWLFTMLQSLSGRLRTTNEKLAALEKAHLGASQAAVADYPFIPLVRSLRIFQLLTHHIGQKEGTNIWLDWQTTLDWWMSLTGWSRDYFVRFVTAMEKHGLMSK
ncbi:MAG: hypothetical protein EBV76_09505, partial [Gammaproteobacteria bacterium]|nr:hypothetical protein [Gammaproteobacteria bacterium]